MNDTHVTIRGWIGGEPKLFDKRSAGENPNRATTIFRVGVTPRYFNRFENQYTDGATTWYSVRCYGALAKNAAMSLSKGMPVMVRGRLTTRLWMDKSGNQNSELAIIADSVGVELSNGIVDYTKRSDRVLKPQPGEPGWTDVSERTEPEQGWTGTGDSRAGTGDSRAGTSGSRADMGAPGAEGVVDQNGGVGENGGVDVRGVVDADGVVPDDVDLADLEALDDELDDTLDDALEDADYGEDDHELVDA
mgnify:CR=1 FL=1